MSYEFLSSETVKARKRHRCIWCGESIIPGETYIRVAGVFEGDFQGDKYHVECRAAAELHFADDDEFIPHENERPPSTAALEFDSWDCALLLQRSLA